jgi:hypothetical protein
MPARHPGSGVLTENVRGIDVERGATGELNRIFGLKFIELLKECLPNISNSHLAFNSDFHINNPNINNIMKSLYFYYTTFGQ